MQSSTGVTRCGRVMLGSSRAFKIDVQYLAVIENVGGMDFLIFLIGVVKMVQRVQSI